VIERAAELAGTTLVAEVSGVDTRPPRPRPPERPTLPDDTFAAIARPLLSMGRLDGSILVHEAERYLAGRRLLDDARAEGWAALPPPGESADSWARVLVDNFGEENAKASGLLYRTRAGWSFTHGENRLLIPWRSPDGEVYTIQRRRLDNASGSGVQKYVFPKGRAARWPYGCERIAAGARIAVVEGAFDVLALRRIAAIEGEEASIVGIPGNGSVELAAKVAVPEVVILALDSDASGTDANKALRKALKHAGATRVLRWNPAPSKDWAARLEALP
jgi:DNA primase